MIADKVLSYKMCKHISKVIMCRSAAICMALDHYNNLAPCQKPPCPKLEYSDGIGYRILGKFMFMKPWAQPANHEMSMKYFKVLWSKEEIIHLHVKVSHLATWIDHDEKQIATTEERLWNAGSDKLAAEM